MKGFENAGNDSRIEAARMTARLYSGELAADDEKKLNDWLNSSDANSTAYNEMLETWDLAAGLEGRLGELENRKHTSLSGTATKPLAVAAGLLLAVSLIALIVFENGFRHSDSVASGAENTVSYVTEVGEQKRIGLPDGSVVHLNTNSRIIADYSGRDRRIALVRGEAFFEVRADPLRPFTVDVDSRSVTVLGTQFGVHKDGFQMEVSVTEGVVAVHRQQSKVSSSLASSVAAPSGDNPVAGSIAGQYRLQAGVIARFSGELGSASSMVDATYSKDLGNYPDWRSGKLVFNNQSLYEVVKEINRYSKIKILIEDSRIMDMKISSSMQLNNIDAALDSFGAVLPLRITRHIDRIVIVGEF